MHTRHVLTVFLLIFKNPGSVYLEVREQVLWLRVRLVHDWRCECFHIFHTNAQYFSFPVYHVEVKLVNECLLGDDLFIIPSNLRAYLNSDEIKTAAKDNTPLFLGRRFQIPKAQLFNSGGAGYILNRAALKLLVDNLDNPECRPHQKVFAEDVNVAACLSKFGVFPYDTRDHEESLSTDGHGLRERFHPFTPGQHFTWKPPKKHKPDGSSADWYENYNAPWGVGQGKECCSSKSASFHYVKSNLMPHLYALLYTCRER
jgi:glycoprotein-N-acetylgalactosamine 3-beta-galactosyltransferase